MPKRKKTIALMALGFAFLIWQLIPGSKKVSLEHLGYARVRPATFIRSIFPEANATIRIFPESGQPGEVTLWQDVFDGPALLISGKDPGVVFCLYDFDTEYLLLKIDTSKPFVPLASDDVLKRVLFSSNWKISNETGTDWYEMVYYLNNASTVDFRRKHLPPSCFPLRTSPGTLLRRLAYQHVPMDF